MKKYLLIILFSCQASAVYINHKGLGDVILVPYYTVNNELNTLVSITNTTNQAKAIKINFREGLNGHAVLSYSVYLNANDSWVFALVSDVSTVSDFGEFEGQDSVKQYTSDESCAPFLFKFGKEFLPNELVDGPQNLSRSREGFIEVIEMGVLDNDFALAVQQDTEGMPENCDLIEQAWQADGVWHADSSGDPGHDILPGSGGLMAQADIINVLEGINFSIPVVALDGFFTGESINHVAPDVTNLSLDAADPVAQINANNKSYTLSFNSGYDAVSAVLMADELIATYALDSIVAAKSETVFVQPTRRFYFENNINIMSAPFPSDRFVENCNVGNYGGSEIEQVIYDRASQIEIPTGGTVTRPPPPPNEAICGSVFVRYNVRPGQPVGQPFITQSNNSAANPTLSALHATENGFISTRFVDTRPLLATDINSNQSIKLMGLPIIGIVLQQYTNGGAAEGLLAQYGGSHQVKSKMRVIEQ